MSGKKRKIYKKNNIFVGNTLRNTAVLSNTVQRNIKCNIIHTFYEENNFPDELKNVGGLVILRKIPDRVSNKIYDPL